MIRNLKNVRDILRKLRSIMTTTQKKYAVLVFFMILVGSLFEMLGVSVILPLLQAMMEPEELMRKEYLSDIVIFFHIQSATQMVNLMCFFTILLYCMKNAYMCLLTFAKNKFSCKVQRELAVKMMNSYLEREYSFFLNYSTSQCLRDIGTDVAGVNTILNQGLGFLSEILTIVMIFSFIIITDYRIGIVLICVAILCLIVVIKVFKELCQRLGKKMREYGERVYKYELEAFEGLKEIMIMQRQSFFIKHYEDEIVKQNKASTQFQLAQASPAYLIEALCVSGLLLYLGIDNNSSQGMALMIPQLGTFAIAAFRILPSLGKISSNINNIVYAVPMVNATYEHIMDVERKAEQRGEEKITSEIRSISFNDAICINDISWKYPNAEKYVIKDLTMKIQKGSSVAFIGTSGAGKTTLADIILGIYPPQKGNITVDGLDIRDVKEAWSHVIGYVPQSVYLVDDTIRNNIAFGIREKEIDDERVWHVLEKAQLKDFMKELPNGLDTKVGEHGVRFSGGQKQRLAIARALYHDPEILVLDEATSALDTETEKAIIEAIDSLKGEKTMIVVAHRLATIRNCDVVYEIADGRAVYKEKKDIFPERARGYYCETIGNVNEGQSKNI